MQPLRCTQVGCGEKCHYQTRCSRIKRYATSAGWRCSIHANDPQAPRPHRVEPEQPTDDEGPTADQPGSRKCGACKRTVRTGTNLQCAACKNLYHRQIKCSNLTRETVTKLLDEGREWSCSACENPAERSFRTAPTEAEPISERTEGDHQSSHRVLQWNADGLATKASELEDVMRRQRIDLVNVQETKLQPHMMTPKMRGYTAVNREDRRGGMKGGGLITYVRESLVHACASAGSKHGTEWTSIKVRLSRKMWVHVTNMYIPPPNSTGQRIALHI